jgi:hypothetical protein
MEMPITFPVMHNALQYMFQASDMMVEEDLSSLTNEGRERVNAGAFLSDSHQLIELEMLQRFRLH